ncbi:MAG: hypothetical protein ACI4WW_01850 [Candidatus Coprovivens sp.]
MSKEVNLEIIDLYKNKFMDLKKKLNIEELRNSIGKYIIIRSYVSTYLRKSIDEGIYYLKDVTNDCLKVAIDDTSDNVLVIEFDRIREYEILNKNEKIIDFLSNIDYDYNHLIEITNIYGKKIRVVLFYVTDYYENIISEISELNFNFKYKISEDDYKYDMTNYPVGLIKDIKILDKYSFNNIISIINYCADYYKTEVEYLTSPESEEEQVRLAKVIKLIKRLENLNNDYIAQFICCNYNFVLESLKMFDDSNINREIKIDFNDIKYYLDNLK